MNQYVAGGAMYHRSSSVSDQYDWSRLEGSGWRHPGGSHNHIECDRWNYYYGSGLLAFRLHVIPADPDETLRVHQEVHALVATCRRDWRDEVKQACEGGPAVMWYDAPRTRASVTWGAREWSSQILMNSDRTWQMCARTSAIEILLAISLIIERLKKRGWREA